MGRSILFNISDENELEEIDKRWITWILYTVCKLFIALLSKIVTIICIFYYFYWLDIDTRLMGNDVKRSIKRIFEKLFSGELLCLYTYHGIRNKKTFSSLNICAIIFGMLYYSK